MDELLSFPIPPQRAIEQPQIIINESTHPKTTFNPSNPPNLPLPPTPTSSKSSKRSSYFDSYPDRKRNSVFNSQVATVSQSSLATSHNYSDDLVDLENSLWTVLGDAADDTLADLEHRLFIPEQPSSAPLPAVSHLESPTSSLPPSPKLLDLISKTPRPRKKAAPPSSQGSSRVTSMDSLQPIKLSVSKRRSLQRMNSRASFRAEDGSEESDLDIGGSLTDVATKYGFKGCADKGSERAQPTYSTLSAQSAQSVQSLQSTLSISPPTPSRSLRKCKSTATLTNQTNGWSDDEDRDTLGPPPPPSSRLKAKASKRALRESREMTQLSRAGSILGTSKNLPSPLLKPSEPSTPNSPNSTSPRSPYSFSTTSVASTAITEDIGRVHSKESLADSYRSANKSLTSTKVVVNHPLHHSGHSLIHGSSSSSEDEMSDIESRKSGAKRMKSRSSMPAPYRHANRSQQSLQTLQSPYSPLATPTHIAYDESLTRIKPQRVSTYASLQQLKNGNVDRRATLGGSTNASTSSLASASTSTPRKVPRSSLPSRLAANDDDATPRPKKLGVPGQSASSRRASTTSARSEKSIKSAASSTSLRSAASDSATPTRMPRRQASGVRSEQDVGITGSSNKENKNSNLYSLRDCQSSPAVNKNSAGITRSRSSLSTNTAATSSTSRTAASSKSPSQVSTSSAYSASTGRSTLTPRKSESDVKQSTRNSINRQSLSTAQRASSASLNRVSQGITHSYDIPPVPSLPKELKLRTLPTKLMGSKIAQTTQTAKSTQNVQTAQTAQTAQTPTKTLTQTRPTQNTQKTPSRLPSIPSLKPPSTTSIPKSPRSPSLHTNIPLPSPSNAIPRR